MNSHADLIELALREDIGPGDVTTDNLVPPHRQGRGVIWTKEPLVIAGLDVARQVFETLSPDHLNFETNCRDGDFLTAGVSVLVVEGPLKTLLMGERTALNFIQRLSGIATHVRRYVEMLGSRPVRLVDTRKTTPGWRVLEKYAVRVGGARNHRMGLYDGVLIKDNHIAVCGSIEAAVAAVRSRISHLVKIEVEASDLNQVSEALAARADTIMLDNMDIEQIRQAVQLVNRRALVEVSGGVTRDNLLLLADSGVDLISVGALTHGARGVDLSMRIDDTDS